MQFLKTMQNSLYSPEFYQEKLTSSLKKGLLYYLLFLLLISFIHVIFSFPSFLTAQKEIDATVFQFIQAYPENLDLSIKKGILTTTAPEPYKIPLPPSSITADQPEFALIIDTKTPYSSKQFNTYDTLAWASRDTLFYQEGEGQVRSFDLSSIDSFDLNKTIVTQFGSTIKPWMVWVGPLLSVFAYLFLLLSGLIRLFYLLFLALVVILIGKLFARPIKFKSAYTILLYAVTLPLIITTVLDIFSDLFGFHSAPFVFTTVTLLAVIANLFLPFSKKKA